MKLWNRKQTRNRNRQRRRNTRPGTRLQMEVLEPRQLMAGDLGFDSFEYSLPILEDALSVYVNYELATNAAKANASSVKPVSQAVSTGPDLPNHGQRLETIKNASNASGLHPDVLSPFGKHAADENMVFLIRNPKEASREHCGSFDAQPKPCTVGSKTDADAGYIRFENEAELRRHVEDGRINQAYAVDNQLRLDDDLFLVNEDGRRYYSDIDLLEVRDADTGVRVLTGSGSIPEEGQAFRKTLDEAINPNGKLAAEFSEFRLIQHGADLEFINGPTFDPSETVTAVTPERIHIFEGETQWRPFLDGMEFEGYSPELVERAGGSSYDIRPESYQRPGQVADAVDDASKASSAAADTAKAANSLDDTAKAANTLDDAAKAASATADAAKGAKALAATLVGPGDLIVPVVGIYMFETNQKEYGTAYAVTQTIPIVDDVANGVLAGHTAATTDWSQVTGSDVEQAMSEKLPVYAAPKQAMHVAGQAVKAVSQGRVRTLVGMVGAGLEEWGNQTSMWGLNPFAAAQRGLGRALQYVGD